MVALVVAPGGVEVLSTSIRTTSPEVAGGATASAFAQRRSAAVPFRILSLWLCSVRKFERSL
jgi:hypothetical protein